MAKYDKTFISRVAACIRSNGGDLTSWTRCKVAVNGDNSGCTLYDEIIGEVELLVQFTFAGEDACVVDRGVIVVNGPVMLYGPDHHRNRINVELIQALDVALTGVEKKVREKLKEMRPTVKERKLKRKTAAVMKQFYQPNIANR